MPAPDRVAGYAPQRVELLITARCPHAERAESILRQALAEALGAEPEIDRVLVSDLDHAAGLGFHGSPTIRLDGRDAAPVDGAPIGLDCRSYVQPDGSLDGVVPAPSIHAALQRMAAERQAAEEARTTPREIPGKISRAFFLWASRQRWMAALVRSFPLTRPMVRRFIAGDDLDDALLVLERLRRDGLRWTVDVLGESVASREMARAAADRYLATLDALAEQGLEANVSLKLTQMGLDIDEDFCRANVARIVGRARDLGAFVRIDMEDHARTDVTLAIARSLHAEYHDVGVVIQSYLRRSAADVERLIADRVRVRLCKGAYDEPSSVAFAHKAEVDRSFVELMQRLLVDGRYPALATHDEAMIERAVELCASHGIGPERFEFQMLYGVRRDLQERLVEQGWTVRVYVPYGGQWYPYYMRRLAERPANVLFLLRSVLSEGRGGRD